MFQKSFIFGAATASFQIEGASDIEGKVKSIWDSFCENTDLILDGSNGKFACMSYYKYKEDIKLLKKLGVDSYRFSISWSRIINEDFKVNQKGIEYYRLLCLELKKNNIKPLVTLYHWDMPEFIEKLGGFLNDNIVDWFYDYVDVVTKSLGDIVSDYITINEPQCIMFMGHKACLHAPGVLYSDKQMLKAIHNLLKCHGKACLAIRKNVKNSTIGISPCSTAVVPSRIDETLYKKCYEKFFELGDDYYYSNLVSIYSDPIFLGDYPKEYYIRFKDNLPDITKEDLELINQPLDYCYQNVYTGNYWDFDEEGNLVKLKDKLGLPMGDVDWLKIVPEGLYYIPKFLYERYKKPIIISENGLCCHDVISLDGKVHDPNRIDYIRRYLLYLEKASKEVDIRGYYYWSLLDNFEWGYGYRKRFGLVFVDYESYDRIPKDSFFEYKKIISLCKEK